MHGVRLLELNAPDMVDVLHYMYESDLLDIQYELQEAKDKARRMIYEEMYETTYIYGSSMQQDYSVTGPPLGDDDDDDFPTPLNPKMPGSRPRPYSPPTKFNPNAVRPYAALRDAPLEH